MFLSGALAPRLALSMANEHGRLSVEARAGIPGPAAVAAIQAKSNTCEQ